MKILYLCDDFPPSSYGGAGVIVYNLAVKLRAMGHDICVVTTTQKQDDSGFQNQEGLKVFRIFSKYHDRWRAYISLFNPQTLKDIKRVLEEFKPDVVHAHHVHQHLSYYSLKLAKRYTERLIMTFHDTMCYSYGKVPDESKRNYTQDLRYRFRYNPFRNIVIKHYLKKYVDVKIAVSSSLQNALQNNGFENIEVIHNGIDIRTWTVSEKQKSEFIQKNELVGKRTVMFGGRLSGPKGGEKIILAMETVIKKFPETLLLIAGSVDGYAAFMKKRAKQLNLLNQLKFLGWLGREEIKVAYHVCDLVVVPSVYLDPFPTVNLEAMAAKKAVVATSFGGSPEAVVDGVTGYIVDPNNIAELSQKIIDLLQDNENNKFGQRGYERVKNVFSIDNQVSKYLNLYRK